MDLSIQGMFLSVMFSFRVQSFFGFGQSAEIDVVLDGQDTRKTAEIKTEDGKKERHYLYFDGETVSGQVCGHVPWWMLVILVWLCV